MRSLSVRIAGVIIAFCGFSSVEAQQQPVLRCELHAPEIRADYVNLVYKPMPIPVTVTVTNIGTALTDSVYARIELTGDLKMADSLDDNGQLLQPAQLFPQQSGTARWMLVHPRTPVEKRYTISVWVRTRNADSSLCETEIIIPPLGSPVLSPRCFVPNALHFDDTLDSYVPNPFTVRLTCVNRGDVTADSVSGTIILPRYVEFDPPGQPATKLYDPCSMEQWQLGDPIPELTWTLRWNPRLRFTMEPTFRFTVTGKHPAGFWLDSVDVRGMTRVPGLLPEFACASFELPDSLALNEEETNVEPNPFTVSYTVRNVSHQTGSIERIIIYFPTSDGLSLDPASPNLVSFDPDLTFAPGEKATFEWLISVENRITRRNVEILVIAYDDEGDPTAASAMLPIANLKTALRSLALETDAPVLLYDPVHDTYDPETFVITATLRNSGGANLNDIVAKLTWTDNSGQDLVEPNPDFADNTNPKTRGVLLPATEAEFSWGFRLKNRNTTGIPQYIAFNLEYGSRETPYVTNGCETFVQIDPAGTTGVSEPPAPANCILHPVHPNPFHASTVLRFTLPSAMPVHLVVTDALGRDVRNLADTGIRKAGTHTLRFDASELPPGVYYTRLTANGIVRMQKMLLL
ncbi:MAG: T9SS type A sorting domain-containing protein [Bacteroidetes bacterium]|nr:T9SS type A sorting domain-containing protein [Bacteroidota bacterium]